MTNKQQRLIAKQEKAQRRAYEKQLLCNQIKQSPEYKMTEFLSQWFDRRFLDPILGWIFPEVGDVFTAILGVPSIYLCIFKIKSFKLTMAVLYNLLVDMLIGLIPFVGDIIDFFIRSNYKNFLLITGWLEDDPEVVRYVNSRSTFFIIA